MVQRGQSAASGCDRLFTERIEVRVPRDETVILHEEYAQKINKKVSYKIGHH